jgi:hypothetical protein
VYLEAGEAVDPAPSTIIDVTGEVPKVLRDGAIPFEKLRDVVPDLLPASGFSAPSVGPGAGSSTAGS